MPDRCCTVTRSDWRQGDDRPRPERDGIARQELRGRFDDLAAGGDRGTVVTSAEPPRIAREQGAARSSTARSCELAPAITGPAHDGSFSEAVRGKFHRVGSRRRRRPARDIGRVGRVWLRGMAGHDSPDRRRAFILGNVRHQWKVHPRHTSRNQRDDSLVGPTVGISFVRPD